MSEVAGEYGKPDAGCMRDFISKRSDVKRWQEVICESHTGEPSLGDRDEIDQTEKEHRMKKILLTVLENEYSGQTEGCCHSGEIGKHDRGRKTEP